MIGVVSAAGLLAILFQTPAGQPGFSGAWDMDLKASVNLPSSFQSVNTYRMTVRLAGDTVAVNASMKADAREMAFPEFVYLTNGRETHRIDSLRGSERWSKAAWSKDKRSLIVETRIQLTLPTGIVSKTVQKDVWTMPSLAGLRIESTQRKDGADSLRTEIRIYKRVK